MDGRQMVAKLARHMIERAEALNLKGKKRDAETIAYFVGASRALFLAGLTDESSHVATITMCFLVVRGYAALPELAAVKATAPATTETFQQVLAAADEMEVRHDPQTWLTDVLDEAIAAAPTTADAGEIIRSMRRGVQRIL